MIRLVFTILLLILGFLAFILLVERMHRFPGGPRFMVRLLLFSALVACLVSAAWMPDGCYSGEQGAGQTDRG